MGKTTRSLLWMLVMAGAVVGLLAAMNRLPSLIREDFPRQYGSIEEVKRSLGLDNVLAPAYFPEGISWPPSLIIAQKKPYKSVTMEFKKARTPDTALMVTESFVTRSDAEPQRIRLSELKEESRYQLKGKTALLQVGTCEGSMSCSRISWQDNGLHCTVLLMSSPFELIRIAESMIH